MVIDRETGRGCAWSITSKTIARQLIADGIVGKTLFSKPRKNGDGLILTCKDSCGEIYVTARRSQALAPEPLCAPSFIDVGTWMQAVSQFQSYMSLEQNVEDHLIPIMDEYLKNIPDTELVAMTKEFLIGHGVIGMPIRQISGDTYYFNETEIYSLDKGSQLFPYDTRLDFPLFKIRGETCFDMRVWFKAVSQFKVAMTLEECIYIFLETKLVHHAPREQTPFDRLVQIIGRPEYERVPENQDTATFDRIRVTIGLSRYLCPSWQDLRSEVKKYRHEIYQRGLQRIAADRRFKRYGVPINFIKLSDATLLRNFSIELVFELKNRPSSVSKETNKGGNQT